MDICKMASDKAVLLAMNVIIPSPVKLWFLLMVSDNGSTESLWSTPCFRERNFLLILLMNVPEESAIRPYTLLANALRELIHDIVLL